MQGSALCSVHFLLLVNDFFRVVRNDILFLSADEIKIVYTSQPEAVGSTVAKINKDLISVNIWENKQTMKFSAEKCRTLCYREAQN